MNIGLIAHDNKKKLMENLCIAYRHILCKHDIYATGTTGRLVEEAANLVVHKYLSAHLGGEQQMGAQIINNDIDLMIFLRDPVSPHAYESMDIYRKTIVFMSMQCMRNAEIRFTLSGHRQTKETCVSV